MTRGFLNAVAANNVNLAITHHTRMKEGNAGGQLIDQINQTTRGEVTDLMKFCQGPKQNLQPVPLLIAMGQS